MGIEDRKYREKRYRSDIILKSAKKNFLSHGFKNTKIAQIADDAELSPGTVYLYFKNKKELYLQVFFEMLILLNGNIAEIESRKTLSPEEKLLALQGLFLKIYEEDPAMLISLSRLQSSDLLSHISEDAVSLIKESCSSGMKAISAIVSAGMRNGYFACHNPTSVADMIWATFSGLILLKEIKGNMCMEDDLADNTFHVACKIMARGLAIRK